MRAAAHVTVLPVGRDIQDPEQLSLN